MWLEFAERLQCPRAHRATPLIVVARRAEGRRLLEGVAGCPECSLEVAIAAGSLRFPGAELDVPLSPPLADEHAARVVALLGLAEPGGAVLLGGRYAALADAIARAVDVAPILLNVARAAGSDATCVISGHQRVPFTDGTFRGAALDADTPLPLLLDALRTVAAGGRVLGAAAQPVPAGLRELARDAQEWVAERETISPVVPLRRA